MANLPICSVGLNSTKFYQSRSRFNLKIKANYQTNVQQLYLPKGVNVCSVTFRSVRSIWGGVYGTEGGRLTRRNMVSERNKNV